MELQGCACDRVRETARLTPAPSALSPLGVSASRLYAADGAADGRRGDTAGRRRLTPRPYGPSPSPLLPQTARQTGEGEHGGETTRLTPALRAFPLSASLRAACTPQTARQTGEGAQRLNDDNTP